MPQGVSADLIATKYGFSRDDVDAYAVESQKRAAAAWDEGRFKNSVMPVKDVNGLTILANDEHMRPTTDDADRWAAAQPLLRADGARWAASMRWRPSAIRRSRSVNHVHHAGNSSGIVDGAAAVLIGTKDAAARPRVEAARPHPAPSPISAPSRRSCSPARSPVTQKVLKKAGMTDQRTSTCSSSTRPSPRWCCATCRRSTSRTTRSTSTAAPSPMGHPLGATGAMILGTVLDELERTGKEPALITLCVGAGMGDGDHHRAG